MLPFTASISLGDCFLQSPIFDASPLVPLINSTTCTKSPRSSSSPSRALRTKSAPRRAPRLLRAPRIHCGCAAARPLSLRRPRPSVAAAQSRFSWGSICSCSPTLRSGSPQSHPSRAPPLSLVHAAPKDKSASQSKFARPPSGRCGRYLGNYYYSISSGWACKSAPICMAAPAQRQPPSPRGIHNRQGLSAPAHALPWLPLAQTSWRSTRRAARRASR